MDFNSLRVKEILGVVHYSPAMSHWHTRKRNDHIVGIQISGKALHTFSHGSFTIAENCVYFLNCRDAYTVDLIEQTDAFSIHFTTYDEIDIDSFCIPVSNPMTFVSALQKAETAKVSGNELMLMSSLYRLCAEIDQARDRAYHRKDERVIVAKKYIDEHFRDRSCLEEAIRISGVSDRRFRAMYKDAYGINPARYVLFLKIELAKNLLSAGNVSVSSASELCGFFDIYHFSKVFKNETGISPSKWQKKN